MVVNSRPLSYVLTEDLEEPLTPSHLLIGHRLLSLPGVSAQEDVFDPGYVVSPSSATDLVKRLRHLNKVMDHFWQRWRKEYLIELRDCHCHTGVNSGSHPPVMVGDIALVHDQDHPRTFWRLAKVEKLIESSDNKVRRARVRVGSKSGRSSFLRRLVQLLYPLEVQCSTETQLSEPQKEEGEFQEDRPKCQSRAAAQQARDRMKSWCKELKL